MSIQVPLAPTVVMATFIRNNKGRHGEDKYVDVQKKNTAVWLTTPGENPDMHMVIGPKGIASPIGIKWTDHGPVFMQQISNGFERIECQQRADIQFANLPEGEKAFVTEKQHSGLIESYTVFQLSPNGQIQKPASFSPYIGKHQLISGMENGGIGHLALTSFLGIRITDGTNLPYGREIKASSKPSRPA